VLALESEAVPASLSSRRSFSRTAARPMLVNATWRGAKSVGPVRTRCSMPNTRHRFLRRTLRQSQKVVGLLKEGRSTELTREILSLDPYALDARRVGQDGLYRGLGDCVKHDLGLARSALLEPGRHTLDEPKHDVRL